MRLLMAELTRLRWRRAVLLLILAAFLLPTVVWAGVTWDTRPVSDSEIAAAKAQAREDSQYQRDESKLCELDPDDYAEVTGAPPDSTCEDLLGVPANPDEEYIYYLNRQPLEFGSVLTDASIAASVMVIALLMLMGATFAGADWASGSMSNQLLFENRRTRLWLTKAAAVLISGFLVALVAMAFFWALFALTCALRDVDVTGAQWRAAFDQTARASVTAAAAGLGGYALTMLFRNTIATLGLLLLVTVGGSLFIAVLPFSDPERWMVHANGLAVLQNGYTYWPSGNTVCPADDCSAAMLHVPMSQGVIYFGVVLAVVVVASLVSFRRSDVP